MSARSISGSGSGSGANALAQVTVQARSANLTLSPQSVIFHKGGIEFRSPTQFAPWTEMTLALQSPQDGGRLQCNGVVIACTGNKHAGYHVSMVFTSMSKQAEARLSTLAVTQFH
jgi:hypothetical protein